MAVTLPPEPVGDGPTSSDEAPTVSVIPWYRSEKFKKFLKRWWFPFSMGMMVVLAYLLPAVGRKGGPLYPSITKKVGVGVLFFMTGFSLKAEILWKALLHVRLHMFVQLFNLVFIPLSMFGLTALLSLTTFDANLREGMILLAALPTTVATNVVFTKAAGGNDPAALFNAVFGNIIGVFVTPSWLFALTTQLAEVSFDFVILNLLYMVLAPLLGGQLLRLLLKKRLGEKKLPTSTLASLLLLYMIFCNFCDTFSADIALSVGSVLTLIGILLLIHILYLFLSWFLSGLHQCRLFRFTVQDRVAIVYCCAAKTLSMGLPLLAVLYGDNPSVGIISMPLLIYHPLSILIAGIINPPLKQLTERQLEEQRQGHGIGDAANNTGCQTDGGFVEVKGTVVTTNPSHEVGDEPPHRVALRRLSSGPKSPSRPRQFG